ncbi:MAG: glycoside hydrolase family 27 protein [Candidatus Dormibacteraceae bacterium]
MAPIPPMGWNGFNHFRLWVTAATVEAEARVLVSSGMKAAGYTYVNLDGGWDMRWRNSRGALQPDPAKFPQGIKPVADYIHSLGLKFGIYSSAGVENCARTTAGSYGHYAADAATFASWSVDYLKLDWCDVPYRNYPHMSRPQVDQMLATEMHDALHATGRAIVLDVNGDTSQAPWTWAPRVASMWRTAEDSQDTYRSMVVNFTRNAAHYQLAGRGGWNDPDMLEVGNGGMSITEYKSQFSLWAEMAAPLLAGNDLARMSPAVRNILINQAVIATDQDPLGLQGYAVANANGLWVLTKPLANGDRAVVLFNQTDTLATISTTASQVGLVRAPGYLLFNMWSSAVAETTSAISASVAPHGVEMFRVGRTGDWGLRT